MTNIHAVEDAWERLREAYPERAEQVNDMVDKIRMTVDPPRGCPPDCNPGFCDDPDEEICDRCWANWEERKPRISNADKYFRIASDEDIAAYIVYLTKTYWPLSYDKFDRTQHQEEIHLLTDWLKKEADDGRAIEG